MLVVFDLDGTIADCAHRMHYIMPNPAVDPVTGKKVKRRYDLFHAACVDDGVIQPVADIYVRFVADPNVTVVVLSGRDAATLDDTIDWFGRNGLPLPNEMILKSGDQHLPDVEQKRTRANQLEKKYGKPISMVFEDRDRVVKMWRERGTFVLDVAQL